ncbi:MAG: hypothetical protein ACLSFC_26430 [Enterocloster bolteae]
MEQLLATSMLIVPRWAGIIRVVEAILHHLLCILYLREILLPRSDMISSEHILYIQNTKITNNGIVDSYSGDAVINLDWVRAGTVVYKVLNGTCFVDFDITVKAITAVNTLIVSGLPTSTIVRHGRIAGWENGNISMPFYLNNTDIIANPCSAGRYAGCFSFSII